MESASFRLGPLEFRPTLPSSSDSEGIFVAEIVPEDHKAMKTIGIVWERLTLSIASFIFPHVLID